MTSTFMGRMREKLGILKNNVNVDETQILEMRNSYVNNQNSNSNTTDQYTDNNDTALSSMGFLAKSSKTLVREEIEELIASSKKILTMDKKSPLYMNQGDRNIAIIYDDGEFIVSKGDAGDVRISELIRIAEENNIALKPRKLTDIANIRSLYGSNSESDKDDQNTAEYQKKIYDLINRAAKVKSSDIHIKQLTDVASIHFTIRGEYRFQYDVPENDGLQMMTACFNACTTGDKQLKPTRPTSARLTTSEKFTLPPEVQYLRLEYTPLDNDKRGLTMRIAYKDTDTEVKDIDSLGYEPFQVKKLNVIRRQTTGIIIVSGPTGSGKSTSMKVALEKTGLDRDWRVKIVTIEDPPEFPIKNSWQMPIESGNSIEEKKANYQRSMGSMLRMAPHIGMVGEIRDRDGANLAIEMAKTGHLVWGTVHANSGPEIITRLKGFDLDHIDIKDTQLIRGLIAQRLLKKVCPHCSYKYNDVIVGKVINEDNKVVKVEEYLVEWFSQLPKSLTEGMKVANPNGCNKCNSNGQSSEGYVGRTVVAEIIMPTRKFLECMLIGEHEVAKEEWLSQKDASSMMEHSFIRALRGEVDPHDTQPVGDITLSGIIDKELIRVKELLRIYNFGR